MPAPAAAHAVALRLGLRRGLRPLLGLLEFAMVYRLGGALRGAEALVQRDVVPEQPAAAAVDAAHAGEVRVS